MEHRKNRVFREILLKSLVKVAIFAILITQFGCKQPVEHPETLDPIYADLLSDLNAANAAVTEEQDAIRELKEKLAALPPRDPLRGRMTRELYSHEHNLVQAQQRVKYYEVRADERKEFAQKSYMVAFEADKPWPDPADFEEYKKRKKLRTASRNWEDRVPKTTRYNRQEPTPKKEAKPEGGGHH